MEIFENGIEDSLETRFYKTTTKFIEMTILLYTGNKTT